MKSILLLIMLFFSSGMLTYGQWSNLSSGTNELLISISFPSAQPAIVFQKRAYCIKLLPEETIGITLVQ